MINTSRWRACSIAVAALTAVLAAMSLSNPAPARADSPPSAPPEPDCGSRFVIISVRGTQEGTTTDQFGDTHINSTYLNAVKDDLEIAEHVSPTDITQKNLAYPADNVSAGRIAQGDLGGYVDSRNTGVFMLNDEIHRYTACAPNRPTLILIGYSQGADVVKRALAQNTTAPDADTVGAALDIADPTRSNDQPALAASGQLNTVNPDWSPVPPPDTSHGGLLDRNPVPSPFADGRFFDLCRDDDIVCNDPNPPGTPGNYADLGIFAAGLDNAHHQSYAGERGGGPQGLDDLAGQISHRAAAAAEAQYISTHPAPPAAPPSAPPAPPPGPPAPPAPPGPPSPPVPPVGNPVPPVAVPPVSVLVPPVAAAPPAPPGPPPLPAPPVSLPAPPANPAPPGPPSLPVPPVTKPAPPTPPPGSVPPPPPVSGVPGPTVHQEDAWGREMNIRRFATTDSRVIYILHGPTTVDVQCQVHGQRVIYGPYDNDGWSYLPAYGGWISDIFISRNRMVPRVPDCGSTSAPNRRADVPRVAIPGSVTPAPEVLTPFESASAPPAAPQASHPPAPAQTPTAPSRAPQPPATPAPAPSQKPSQAPVLGGTSLL